MILTLSQPVNTVTFKTGFPSIHWGKPVLKVTVLTGCESCQEIFVCMKKLESYVVSPLISIFHIIILHLCIEKKMSSYYTTLLYFLEMSSVLIFIHIFRMIKISQ